MSHSVMPLATKADINPGKPDRRVTGNEVNAQEQLALAASAHFHVANRFAVNLDVSAVTECTALCGVLKHAWQLNLKCSRMARA